MLSSLPLKWSYSYNLFIEHANIPANVRSSVVLFWGLELMRSQQNTYPSQFGFLRHKIETCLHFGILSVNMQVLKYIAGQFSKQKRIWQKVNSTHTRSSLAVRFLRHKIKKEKATENHILSIVHLQMSKLQNVFLQLIFLLIRVLWERVEALYSGWTIVRKQQQR